MYLYFVYERYNTACLDIMIQLICSCFLILKKKPRKECKKNHHKISLCLDWWKMFKSGMCAKLNVKKHKHGNDNTEVLHSKQSVRTGELEWI